MLRTLTHHRASDRTRTRGVAMVLVLIALAMATVIGLSFLNTQSTTTGIARNVGNQTHARGIAESALEMTIDHLRNNTSWRQDKTQGTWLTNQALDGGTYTIMVQDGYIDADGNVVGDGDLSNNITDKVVITAIGKYKGVAHSIRAQITPSSSGPQHTVLFVQAGASPDSHESARINLIKSMNYDISTIVCSESQSNFNEKIASCNVIYVSSRVSGVVNKIVNAGIGIVTEQSDTFSTLGFATSYSSFSGDSINIVDNSHAVTENFSTGELQITTSIQTLNKLSGTCSDDLISQGKQPYNNSTALAILVKGAAMAGGSTTTGRRVMLPWGSSSFDIASLNSNGRSLLKSALNWAATTPTEGGGSWTSQDIGFTSPAGSITSDAGSYTILAAGNDIWNNSDQFRFTYQSVTGDGELIARVVSVSNTNSWAKAGVMVRESLDANSRHVMTVVTPSEGVAFQRRLTTGGTSYHTNNSGSAAYWVKIVREGNTIRGYKSSTGSAGTWQSTGDAITLPGLSDTVYFGLCLSSHNSGSLCTAKFDNLTLITSQQQAAQPDPEITEDTPAPNLIVQYAFNEVTPPTPVLMHRWKLDETTEPPRNTGMYGNGVSAGTQLTMALNAQIDSYNTDEGYYTYTKCAKATVVVNSTASGAITLTSSAKIYGDAYCGYGGNPSNAISASSSAISGTRQSQNPNTALPTSIPLPVLTSPATSLNIGSSGTKTLHGHYNLGDVYISGSVKLICSGAVVIICNNFTMTDNTELFIPEDSTLTVYAKNGISFSKYAIMNTRMSPSDSRYTSIGARRLKMYAVNGSNVTLTTDATYEGHIYAYVGSIYATGNLTMNKRAAVYGVASAAGTVTLNDRAWIHIDNHLFAQDPNVTYVVKNEMGSNHGTYKNGPHGPQDGKVGTSVYFDGINDHVLIPHNDNMLLNDGTVAFWFKSEVIDAAQGLFSKDASGYGTGGHLTVLVEDAKVKACLQSASNTVELVSEAIDADTWYHVAVCWGQAGMKLYLNGILAGSNEYTGGLNATGAAGNHEPIVLAASQTTATSLSASPLTGYFRGNLDDVRIYDKGLEEPQALMLYNGTDPGTGTTGYLVEDTANFQTPLNLYVQDTSKVQWINGGGMIFTGNNSAVSTSAATKVHTALTTTNRMTLEVKFQTTSTNQSGPANIISYSNGNYDRNFTFAQEDAVYQMRLRTSETGSNGCTAVTSGSVLDTTTIQHVIVTFDGSVMKFYANGSTTPQVTENLGGTFNWNNAYRLILGNEEGGSNPWIGKLFRFTVYDQALNTLQVKDLFDGNPPGNYEEQENITFHVRWYENP